MTHRGTVSDYRKRGDGLIFSDPQGSPPKGSPALTVNGSNLSSFFFFSSLHLSYPSHRIYHSLSLPVSDSTCICCAIFLPHFNVSSFCSLCVLLSGLISVYSAVFSSATNNLMARQWKFMIKSCYYKPKLFFDK